MASPDVLSKVAHEQRDIAAHFLRQMADKIERQDRILLGQVWQHTKECVESTEPSLRPPAVPEPDELMAALKASLCIPAIAEWLHRADNELLQIQPLTLEQVPERKPFFRDRAELAVKLCHPAYVATGEHAIYLSLEKAVLKLDDSERIALEEAAADMDTEGARDVLMKLAAVAFGAVWSHYATTKREGYPMQSARVVSFPVREQ